MKLASCRQRRCRNRPSTFRRLADGRLRIGIFGYVFPVAGLLEQLRVDDKAHRRLGADDFGHGLLNVGAERLLQPVLQKRLGTPTTS